MGRAATGVRDVTRVDRPAPSEVGLVVGLLVTPTAVGVVTWALGIRFHPVAVFVWTLLLVGVACFRVASTWRRNRATAAELASAERFARALARNASDAVAVVDANGIIDRPGSRLAELAGFDGVEGLGTDVFSRVVDSDVEAGRHVLRDACAKPGTMIETELRFVHRDGSERWVSVRVCSLLDDPDVRGIVLNASDVTDRKEVEHELVHQAFHDPLTGLPNRRRFEQVLERAVRNRRDENTGCALLFVDVDDFKLVNDSLGHDVGDMVIYEVGRRLTAAAGSSDVVGRLGGDEFAILVARDPLTITSEAQRTANHILRSLTNPFNVRDRSLRLLASIGIATADDGSDTHTLMRDANTAMHRAKHTGKGKWVAYDPEMRESAVEQLEMEVDLVEALDNGQFRLVYQPVVEVRNGSIVGLEALIRWRHPVRGDIPPQAFIPLAERNGMILPIGRWVIHEACAAAGEWFRSHPDPDSLYVSVNLSARQITTRGLRDDIIDALAASGLPPTSLMLEVTETALVRDEVMAARRLRELRDLGIRLAIDDFGTGYASLSYLQQFEVDTVKIDRSFVETIIKDVKTVPPLLSGMVDLAGHLRLPTIAEGVEREDQRETLVAAGCRFAQGYLFYRPLECEDVTALFVQQVTQS